MCVDVCVFVYILILGWLVDLAMTVQGPGGAEITRWGPRVFISGGGMGATQYCRGHSPLQKSVPPYGFGRLGLVGRVW